MSFDIEKTYVNAPSRIFMDGWTIDYNDLVNYDEFPFEYLKNGKVKVYIVGKEMRDFIIESTGLSYRVINLSSDDELLLMLKMKFEGKV